MSIKTKVTDKENILEIGWYGKIDNYLSKLVPNGIVKIKDGNSMTQLGFKMKNNYIQEMNEQMKKMMKRQKEFELELVLKNKMSPFVANKSVLKHKVVAQKIKAERLLKTNKKKKLQKKFEPKLMLKNKMSPFTANKSVLKHPVVAQRLKAEQLLKTNKEKLYVKEFEKVLCKDGPSEVEQMGIKFRELEFGESCVFDYYKHGRHLKRKMNEHNKEIGLHLPRSHSQVKIIDHKLNKLTSMKINNLEDLKIFHEMANKLIKEPFQGSYQTSRSE